jgi:two-component system NarL family sensor kinase
VLQESLTNIHRHSASSSAQIKLDCAPHEMVLSVRDFGKGFPVVIQGSKSGRALSRIGVGIRGMQERVRQLGGTISIRNADPGTLVEIHFPLATKPNPDMQDAASSPVEPK